MNRYNAYGESTFPPSFDVLYETGYPKVRLRHHTLDQAQTHGVELTRRGVAEGFVGGRTGDEA